jgi:predicted phosphohydrolase
MRIHVLSDLHLGFGEFSPPRTDADVVILAGDIDQGLRGVRWARRSFGDMPVLYVIGNHEYYGQALPKLTGQFIAEGADWPVRVLERSGVVLDGLRFLGCTLWTDLALYGDPYLAGVSLAQGMTDFRAIRVSPAYRRFRPSDAASLHRASVAWLKSEWGRCDLPPWS